MQQSSLTTARRQFERKTAKTNIFVHHRGRFQRAVVVDYSAGGLQLDGTFGLTKRDPIQVEFISGVRVTGQVAWSLGARTGIVFSQPLPINHAAMSDLSRKANRPLVLSTR